MAKRQQMGWKADERVLLIGPMLVEKVYVGSKLKALGSLLFSIVVLSFVVSQIFPLSDTSFAGVFGLTFFSLGPPVFLTVLIRPYRLHLDGDGFTLSGGFKWKPLKRQWVETGPFFVRKMFRVRNAPFPPVKMIMFDLSSDSSRFSTNGGLPMLWSFNGTVEEMVSELNEYRTKASSAQ